MKKKVTSFVKSAGSMSVAELERYAPGWILDGQCRQLSPQTLYARQLVIGKLLWFLKAKGHGECGVPELRAFLAHISRGHEEEGGRWGSQRSTPVRPRTLATYYGNLRTLFRFLVAEEVIASSPIERISAPPARPDQIQPFSSGQVEALLKAARQSSHPRRNEAIVLLLLDTGMRASELCHLRVRDMDLIGSRCCTVLGKGDKRRILYFSRVTAKAIWQYLNEEARDAGGFVFLSDRSKTAGDPLTRLGLLRLFTRLGKKGGIEATRCSPHTLRHTFAVEFLRAGGNTFTLQQLLGHTDLAMTNRYVALAQADIENQHRQFSPVERLKRRSA